MSAVCAKFSRLKMLNQPIRGRTASFKCSVYIMWAILCHFADCQQWLSSNIVFLECHKLSDDGVISSSSCVLEDAARSELQRSRSKGIVAWQCKRTVWVKTSCIPWSRLIENIQRTKTYLGLLFMGFNIQKYWTIFIYQCNSENYEFGWTRFNFRIKPIRLTWLEIAALNSAWCKL